MQLFFFIINNDNDLTGDFFSLQIPVDTDQWMCAVLIIRCRSTNAAMAGKILYSFLLFLAILQGSHAVDVT